MPAAALALLWLLGGGGALSSPEVDAELSRLDGHEVRLAPDGGSYEILDVAGEGKPFIGVVEERSGNLFLALDGGIRFRLEGPLALPRIAGPGYKVWVIGPLSPLTMSLRPRRLGVLAPPPARPAKGG